MNRLLNGLAGTAIAALLAAPFPALSQQRPATAPAARTQSTTPPSAPSTRTPATATNRFSTEAAAKSHCPGAPVVWVNLKSKIYHLSGSPTYGHTKSGTYMCERDATAGGFRAAKTKKPR